MGSQELGCAAATALAQPCTAPALQPAELRSLDSVTNAANGTIVLEDDPGMVGQAGATSTCRKPAGVPAAAPQAGPWLGPADQKGATGREG